MRRAVQRLDRGNLEDLRAVAQNFTAQPKSVFVATLKDPPSVLLAASADSGVDAGKAAEGGAHRSGRPGRRQRADRPGLGAGCGIAGRFGGEDRVLLKSDCRRRGRSPP